MAKDRIHLPDDMGMNALLSSIVGGNIRAKNRQRKAMYLISTISRYGTSEQLKRKYDAVREAAIINRDLPMDEEDRKRFAAVFNELGNYIRSLAGQMVKVETELEKEGFRVNHETGRVSFRRDGIGRDVVREEIWTIYKSKYQSQGNTPGVRKLIAKELSSYIDKKELSINADSGAIIYDAIRRRESHSK
jgi:hypothetical protein